ncbi:Lateral organ boundaries domain family protein [Hibiscus syriacus]|uniref:Lateral organ boundaries domain family protein n=1 Tax=Hibiscus syriacus TaxID=106335 RepID=A0A6A2XUR1_HIBSY|nr:Lateral organ boundaries domain family protein [Hibiscus syriacus]
MNSDMDPNDDVPDPSPRIFDRYASSDDDDSQPPYPSLHSTNRRLDYMIQFLDRNLLPQQSSRHKSSLPEFVAKGGGQGIFALPDRKPLHPNRPPYLEVRPHPLRETQFGCFLKTIACTDRQLWAGSESGAVRVWELKDLYEEGEEEEAAPYRESLAISSNGNGNGNAAAICIARDEGNGLVWSGHRDGKIRGWKMDCESGGFKEGWCWQAHRGPVLSMVFTSYGDLWSGSEGGNLRIWPWEDIQNALSLTMEERHMASLLMGRSFIDLRSQIAVNGFSSILNSDMKCLLSDNIQAKVWSSGYLSFALWDARTRELLKVFNIDGQIENRADLSLVPDFSVEDEIKMKAVASTKKEKTQSSFGFFQQSRNAIMGAADAVRRVAAKGGFVDDSRRIEALTITIDGMIWVGCANGLLIQWDGNGNRIQDIQLHPSAVLCLCSFGLKIWAGYASGIVQTLDLDGNKIGEWVAHNSSVLMMAIGAGYIYTLAKHGGIRGWSITSPGTLDGILYSELTAKGFLYTRIDNLTILTGTWNVGQGRASKSSLESWLHSAVSDVGIIVIGLQEVEMGAGFLAMSAVRESTNWTLQLVLGGVHLSYVSSNKEERCLLGGIDGSSIGQWLDMIDDTLHDMMERKSQDLMRKQSHPPRRFERVGSRQLAGMLIAVWVKDNLNHMLGILMLLQSHAALGVLLVTSCRSSKADFDHVYRTMSFGRPSNLLNAGADLACHCPFYCSWCFIGCQMARGANVCIGAQSVEGMPELSEADMIVFLGDFIIGLMMCHMMKQEILYLKEALIGLEKGSTPSRDEAGNVFQGAGSSYDSGEKKRIPAWCDRSYTVIADELWDLNADTSILRITNKCKESIALFEIVCQGESTIKDDGQASYHYPRGSFGLPRWLQVKADNVFVMFGQVTPAAGIIQPDHVAEVSIHLEAFHTREEFVNGFPQNWWCEDDKDKEAILVVKVHGRYTMETKNHRIRVRHCCSANVLILSLEILYKFKESPSPRDYQRLGVSSDVVDHLRRLHNSILFPDVPIAHRLSSHLLLGVVRIYSRKVNYLFDDCSEALLKIKQAFRSTAVDLPPEESTAPYHSITLPETFDLDDFELPDNEVFQGNYVDHHISSREQINLQDTTDGVVYSTSQFGLDERFGDGDTSQIGLLD